MRDVHNIKVYLLWYDDKITNPRWSVYIHYPPVYKHYYINGIEDYEEGLEIGLQTALKLI